MAYRCMIGSSTSSKLLVPLSRGIRSIHLRLQWPLFPSKSPLIIHVRTHLARVSKSTNISSQDTSTPPFLQPWQGQRLLLPLVATRMLLQVCILRLPHSSPSQKPVPWCQREREKGVHRGQIARTSAKASPKQQTLAFSQQQWLDTCLTISWQSHDCKLVLKLVMELIFILFPYTYSALVCEVVVAFIINIKTIGIVMSLMCQLQLQGRA